MACRIIVTKLESDIHKYQFLFPKVDISQLTHQYVANSKLKG